MVKAIVRGEHVTLKSGRWKGASPALLVLLDAATEEGRELASGDDPSPELTIAQYVLEKLGGELGVHRPVKDDFVPDQIY